MNKIGFKNFRRFENFPAIDYNGITFLVGRNNAGKSTVVKALILISDFLKSNQVKLFHFGRNTLEDANIVTYDRAKNILAADNFISFSYQFNQFMIDITISGLTDSTAADIHLFSIKDIEHSFEIKFEPQKSLLTINGLPKDDKDIQNELEKNIVSLKKEIIEINKEIKSLKSSNKSYINFERALEVNLLKQKLKKMNKLKKQELVGTPIFSVNTHIDINSSLKSIFDNFLIEVLAIHSSKFTQIQKGKKQDKEFENLKSFKENAYTIEKSFNRFLQAVNTQSFIYLGANPAKQSALFPIRDKNNALAQSIHEFYQLRVNKGEVAYEFIEKWMKKFDIGDDFEIKIYAGESYEVKINSNRKLIHLADKGMGSIQSMLLIFRLAANIQKNIGTSLTPTLIIEEPELNLHPALQSLLADLFLDVYENHGIRFVIETHSEYLIRKTQLLVKEKELEIAPNENFFCVLYFDKEHGPYKMNYREDGKFIESFGPGFFDVSSNLTFDLF